MSNLEKKYTEVTATIPINDTDSDEVRIYGKTIVAIKIPSAMTGTGLSFSVSSDGEDFALFYNDAGGLIETVNTTDTAWHIGIEPADFESVNNIVLISNATELAERKIKLVLRTL